MRQALQLGEESNRALVARLGIVVERIIVHLLEIFVGRDAEDAGDGERDADCEYKLEEQTSDRFEATAVAV